MKCEKCENSIKTKDAKYCPFCGCKIEPIVEIAKYTRAQFFDVAGDEEFRNEWGKLKNMTANEFLNWIRDFPPARYVYRIYGTYKDEYTLGRFKTVSRFIDVGDVKYVNNHGSVTVQKSILTRSCFDEIGINVFFTENECKEAIMKELEERSIREI